MKKLLRACLISPAVVHAHCSFPAWLMRWVENVFDSLYVRSLLVLINYIFISVGLFQSLDGVGLSRLFSSLREACKEELL